MAIDFSGGVDAEVDVGNPSSLQLTGACTIMCWVCSHVAAQNKDIVAKQIGADRGFSLQSDDDATDTWPSFVIATSSSTVEASGWATTKMATTVYYHIAGQFVPSTAVQIWVDGVMEKENTTSIPATMYNSGNTVVIGGRPDPIGNWDGLIDDVRIYNRNLSANEMKTIHAARGADAIMDGLVSRWMINEGAPGVAPSGAGSLKDLGINVNNGTPSGTLTYIASDL